MSEAQAVTRYWLQHYVRDGLCSLCGNTGYVDTRRTAISPAGLNVGSWQPCICPNGQGVRMAGPDAQQKRQAPRDLPVVETTDFLR